MSEEKAKKIATGATIAGVLLIIFLVTVLIVQFVQIGIANAQARKYDEQIAELERLLSDEQSKLQYYETEMGLYHLALENGWSSK